MYETYFHQLNRNSGNIFKEFINALIKYKLSAHYLLGNVKATTIKI